MASHAAGALGSTICSFGEYIPVFLDPAFFIPQRSHKRSQNHILYFFPPFWTSDQSCLRSGVVRTRAKCAGWWFAVGRWGLRSHQHRFWRLPMDDQDDLGCEGLCEGMNRPSRPWMWGHPQQGSFGIGHQGLVLGCAHLGLHVRCPKIRLQVPPQKLRWAKYWNLCIQAGIGAQYALGVKLLANARSF